MSESIRHDVSVKRDLLHMQKRPIQSLGWLGYRFRACLECKAHLRGIGIWGLMSESIRHDERPSMCQKRPSMCQKRPSMCLRAYE